MTLPPGFWLAQEVLNLMKEMADAMVISQASAIEPAIREMSERNSGPKDPK